MAAEKRTRSPCRTSDAANPPAHCGGRCSASWASHGRGLLRRPRRRCPPRVLFCRRGRPSAARHGARSIRARCGVRGRSVAVGVPMPHAGAVASGRRRPSVRTTTPATWPTAADAARASGRSRPVVTRTAVGSDDVTRAIAVAVRNHSPAGVAKRRRSGERLRRARGGTRRRGRGALGRHGAGRARAGRVSRASSSPAPSDLGFAAMATTPRQGRGSGPQAGLGARRGELWFDTWRISAPPVATRREHSDR